METAKKGESVAVRIEGASIVKEYGRHFDNTNPLYSRISLDSLEQLHDVFGDELTTEDKALLKDMKKLFKSRLSVV